MASRNIRFFLSLIFVSSNLFIISKGNGQQDLRGNLPEQACIIFQNTIDKPLQVEISTSRIVPSQIPVIISATLRDSLTETVEIDNPAFISLSIEGSRYWLYMEPADTIRLFLSRGNGGLLLNFKGDKAAVNQLLIEKNTILGFTFLSEVTPRIIHSSGDMSLIFNRLDSILLREVNFWTTHRDQISANTLRQLTRLGYIETFLAKMTVGRSKGLIYAQLLNLLPDLAKSSQETLQGVSKGFPSVYLWLQYYSFIKIGTDLSASFVDKYSKASDLLKNEGLDSLLLEQFHGFWLSWMMSMIQNEVELKRYSLLWQKVSIDVKDMSIKSVIDDILRHKREDMRIDEVAKNIDEFLSFGFENVKGDRGTLKTHKGKWIYVDLWATWCTACLEDLNYKQASILPSLSKEVVFVNICMRSDYNKWKLMLGKREWKGINLFADEKLSGKVEAMLRVYGYPHYLLIKPDGSLYQNAAYRPQQLYPIIGKIIK